MIHLFVFALCLAGFAGLALATERAQDDLFGRPLSSVPTRLLRGLGWGAVSVALVVSVITWGWAFGLVAYSGHTSLAAGSVFGALVLAGRWRSCDRR